MVSAVCIRNAVTADAKQIAQLCQLFGYSVSQNHITETLNRIAGDSDQQVYVALLDNQTVAWIHVFISRRLESSPFVEIGGMVVDDALRRQGIGRKLIQQAEQWAKQRGLTKLRVRCADQRSGAHKFYRALNMSKSKVQLVFDKPLRE